MFLPSFFVVCFVSFFPLRLYTLKSFVLKNFKYLIESTVSTFHKYLIECTLCGSFSNSQIYCRLVSADYKRKRD